MRPAPTTARSTRTPTHQLARAGSWAAESGGPDAVYGIVALTFLPGMVLPASFSGYRPTRSGMSPSRSNLVLIGALAALSMTGSALFVHSAVIGRRVVGLDPYLVSAGLAANALFGFVAARRAGGSSPPRIWLYAMAPALAAVAFGKTGALWIAGMAAWGFFFWMVVPKMLGAIADWSLAPEERVGDAQSAMAVGRALGPAIAATLISDGGFGALGLFSTVGVLLTAVTVHGVAAYRRKYSQPAAYRQSKETP